MIVRPYQFLAVMACLCYGLGAFAQERFNIPKRTDLPGPVHMHGSAVVGNRLYAFGGDVPEGWTNAVTSAEILPSGELGAWRQEKPLPERRSYISQAVEVVNNRIYICGGSISSALDPKSVIVSAKDVLWTEVLPDGSPGEWKHSEPFKTNARLCTATCSTENHLFVTGGSEKQTVLTEVMAADYDKDGKPVNWRVAAQLPTPLWFHGAAILENRMFLWGGLTTRESESMTANVWSAEVSNGPTFGQWRKEKSLPTALNASAFCGFNDYLVCVSGRRPTGKVSTDIIYGYVKDGALQYWNTIPTNLEAQVYLPLGLDKTRGWIFINGGQQRLSGDNRRQLSTVQAFALTAPKTQTVAAAAPAAAAPKGKELSAALVDARSSNKDVLAYFYSPEVPACSRLEANVMAKPQFKSVADKFVMAGIDATKDSASCSKYSVFKVPCLVQIGADGKAKKTSKRLITMEDFQAFMSGS